MAPASQPKWSPAVHLPTALCQRARQENVRRTVGPVPAVRRSGLGGLRADCCHGAHPERTSAVGAVIAVIWARSHPERTSTVTGPNPTVLLTDALTADAVDDVSGDTDPGSDGGRGRIPGVDPDLLAVAARVGQALNERGETVGVAEGSCGGLVSAALLAVPGASAYYAGGAVIYTLAANRAFLRRGRSRPARAAWGDRGRSPRTWPARPSPSSTARGGSARAARPARRGNRYGDPSGHAWLAVAGPSPTTRTCSPAPTTASPT